MERRVKERLIGAAVLMAAAIILIPEMLSGPRRAGEVTSARAASESPVKTYTIDLSRSPGSQAQAIETPAPPPEESVPPQTEITTPAPSEAARSPEIQAVGPQASPESGSPVEDEPAVQPTREPTPQSAATRTPTVVVRDTPAPIATTPAVPTSRGWAVQLGSFASRATADRIAQESASKGQKAFVMPVKSGSNTLYRVRIGPFADRAAANDVLRDVKSRVANAAIVAHP